MGVTLPLAGLIIASIQTIFLFLLKDKFFSWGFVDKDIHKPDKPLVPVMGVILSLSIFTFTFFTYWRMGNLKFFKIGIVIISSTIFGLIDDHLNLGKYEKLLSIILISSIAIALKLELKSILFLPFVMFISNSVNSLAGFNGLEAGTSLIISSFLIVSAIMLNISSLPGYMLGIVFLLASFLSLNKYPAEILAGDVGTSTIGGLFASTSLYFEFVPLMLALLTPHLIDIFLKTFSLKGIPSFREIALTKVRKTGKLIPRKRTNSLVKSILSVRQLDEPKLVSTIWIFQAIVGFMVLGFLRVMI